MRDSETFNRRFKNICWNWHLLFSTFFEKKKKTIQVYFEIFWLKLLLIVLSCTFFLAKIKIASYLYSRLRDGNGCAARTMEPECLMPSKYHTKFNIITKGLFTWRWGTPGRWGNPLRLGNPPVHIISHFKLITFTWSVRWPAACYLTYVGSPTSM